MVENLEYFQLTVTEPFELDQMTFEGAFQCPCSGSICNASISKIMLLRALNVCRDWVPPPHWAAYAVPHRPHCKKKKTSYIQSKSPPFQYSSYSCKKYFIKYWLCFCSMDIYLAHPFHSKAVGHEASEPRTNENVVMVEMSARRQDIRWLGNRTLWKVSNFVI